MHKILIIQTASIGDVILTTPLVEKLHKHYPDAQIDLCLKKGNESLFESHPFLNQIHIWDKSRNKYANLYKLIKNIRKQKYDLVVCLQRFFTGGLIAGCSKGKDIVGFSKNPLSIFFTKSFIHEIGQEVYKHEVERNLSLIESYTDSGFEMPKLYPTLRNIDAVSTYKTNRYICIAPLSLWFTKQFPQDKWIDFAKQIDPELNIYYLGSPKDSAVCDEIITQSKHPHSINLAGKLSLLESAALMKDAVMNFVNDSAPLHIASSTNAKTTAVFCSTVVEFGFGPLSDGAVVVQIQEDLSCRPCGLHGYKACPQGHFKCAYDIDVNLLLARLNT